MTEEIVDRLNEIRATQQRTERTLCEVRDVLTGGSEPDKGMIVRLDRAEQQVTNQKWTLRTLFAAAVAAVFGYFVR